MSRKNVGTVCFTVEGEFITDLARTFVREGDWKKGLSTLKDSIIGISTDYCIDILSGKSKMVGSNEFDLVEDDLINNEEWLKEQYYSYFSGVFYYEGKFYKPYGHVESLNAKDLSIALENMGLESVPTNAGYTDEVTIDLNLERAGTYKNRLSDFVFYSPSENVWVLSETIEAFDYPMWISKEQAISMCKGSLRIRHGLDESELAEIAKTRVELENNRRIDAECRMVAPKKVSTLDAYIENQRKADELFNNPSQFKKTISRQADNNGGWLELENNKTGAKYKLPKNPFFRWCLSNSTAYDSITWSCVCPSGVKMGGDDPNHTDWWLFTGLSADIANDHNHPENNFFFKMRHKYMSELTGGDLVVLSNIKNHKGFKKAFVRHVKKPGQIDYINNNDVIIIPNASPDFEAVAHRCAEKNCILITETGGKLCHLATVGREFGLALFMMPDAMKKFPMASSVTVDCDNATIEALDMEMDKLMELKLTGMRYR